MTPSAETELVSYSPAKLINLPTLRRTGALVAAATIPADATAVRVYVGPQAKLQQADGSVLDVSLSAPTGYLEFKLETWNATSGALALDFDLPRFTLQGSTLLPATRVASSSDYSAWNQRYAEVQGTVTQVTATSLVVDAKGLGLRSLVLDSNTTFVSSRSSTWTPSVGDVVDVKSTVAGQGAALTLTARTVQDQTGVAASAYTKVEGVVITVSGTQVTVMVDHSTGTLVTGSVAFDIAGASYKRGSVAAVQQGTRIEAYLSQSGTALSAQVIEIEGAGISNAGENNSLAYADLKGQILSVNGSVVVVKVLVAEAGSSLAPGTELRIDTAVARFDAGGITCLVAGLPIEIKGSLDASGTLKPVEVSVGGACAAAYPAEDGARSGQQDKVVTAGAIDTEGSVTAVRAGEFDIAVFDLRNTSMLTTKLTVQYSSTTVFRQTSAQAISVGAFLEVRGDLKEGVIAATIVALR